MKKYIATTLGLLFLLLLTATVGEALAADGSSWGESKTREAGHRAFLEVDGSEYGFVWIPAGEFDMGAPESEEGRCADEVLHRVKLTRGFWLLETPTTQKLYQQITGKNPSSFKGDDLPVENVSYDEAVEFCKELTKWLPEGLRASLPTEAQWEYACRAGTTTAFSWGESWDKDKGNGNHGVMLRFEPHEKNADRLVPVLRDPTKTSPVKTYSPNSWGLYDMHGNVREWTSDWYGAYPQCSEENPAVDPKGADCAETKVCRGGAWYGYDWSCRAAYRVGYFPDDHASYLGFRFLLICE